MHKIDMMKEKLEHELESYAGVQTLNKSVICEIKEIAQTIHYLNKISDHDQMGDEASMRSYRGSYEGSYDDGMSTRRGRDSMGRFVSRDMGPRGNAREYGSYGGSYNDSKAHLMEKLEDLARSAQQDPQMKQALDQCMDKIERM